MKKKEIEKIPWKTGGKGKGMYVVARIEQIKGQDTLLIDITKEKPIIRLCLTEYDFANYIPEESPIANGKPWNGKKYSSLEINNKLNRYSRVESKTKHDGPACSMGIWRPMKMKENFRVHISEESAGAIRNLTRITHETTWDIMISHWQEGILRERSERKEELRWSRIEKRMKTVPEVPNGFDKWIKNSIKAESLMSILPFRKAKTTIGICSNCGKQAEFKRGEVKHKKETKCPQCGKTMMARRLDWKNQNPLPVVQKAKSAILFQSTSEGYVERYYEVWKNISFDNEKVEYVEIGRKFRIKRKDYYYFHKSGWSSSFWDDRNLYGMNNIRLIPGAVFPGNIKEKMFEGTEYKYCAFSIMHKEPGFVPITWLEKYEMIPQIEMMAKIGLKKLALQIRKTDFLEGDKPWSMMGISKEQFNRLRRINGGREEMIWMKYEKMSANPILDNIIKYFSENQISPEDIKFISDRMSAMKIFNYLKRQSVICNRSPKDTVGTWQDYLSMATRMKMSVTDELIFKPKDLLKSHDDAVKLCGGVAATKRANEILKIFPDVDNICKSIIEKYSYNDEQYSIIVPEKIEDIIVEGRTLGHCLDSSDIYFDRIQQKESFIVFLRKMEEIDKPYYTLEIEPGGTARQKRTTGDKQNKDFDEAKKFIRKWQHEIQKRLSREDKELADVSAKLRVKEFEELKKSKTKIWHGALAGKLLVEVLEADLMEFAEEDRRCG